jgi:hypothetical protein
MKQRVRREIARRRVSRLSPDKTIQSQTSEDISDVIKDEEYYITTLKWSGPYIATDIRGKGTHDELVWGLVPHMIPPGRALSSS